MIRTLGCLPALIRPPFRCSTVPLQARTRNGTTTATLRVIYPATNLGPGRATQQRVLRSAVIGVKENDYFQSAVTIGASKWRILLRHMLPNIAAPIIVVFSINVGGVIISEAALSFLGFGLPIEIPSWGGLLSREGRQYMETAPHLAFWPGLALTITVYCFNMFGDAVRDLLDPRLIGGAGRLGAHRTEGARSV